MNAVLAVEYDGPDPEPLPNLDFKIETGDSLLAPDPSGGLEPDMFRRQQIEEFRRKKAEFADPYSNADKSALRREIEALRQEIAAWAHPNGQVQGFDWAVEFVEVFETGGGFDIVLANPPYGEGSVSDTLRDALFGPRSGQSKDIYAAFIARAFQLMRPGGMMTYITSNTWRTIRTHRPLRKLLLARATILHFLDVPEWVFDAVVRTCVSTMRNAPAAAGHRMIVADLMALPANDWTTLEANLCAVASHGPDLQTDTFARYTYPQAQVSQDPNAAFFIALPSLQRFFTDRRCRRLGEEPDPVARVVVGLQTGDNGYYLRKAGGGGAMYRAVEPNLVLTGAQLREFASRPVDERLQGIDPAEFGGRHFVPYDKGGDSDLHAGGWLPCFWVPTEYFIDWSQASVQRLRTATIADRKRRQGEQARIRAGDDQKRAAVIRNPDFYFSTGLTFSRTGRYAPTFRLGAGAVFDTEGSSLFPSSGQGDEALALLGLLNTRLVRMLVKTFLNNAWHAEIEDLKRVPVIGEVLQSAELTEAVRHIVKRQQAEPRYSFWQHEGLRIEEVVEQAYGLTPEEVRDIDLWLCRYERGRLAEARGLLAEARERYAPYLARCQRILADDPRKWTEDPILALVAQGESASLEFKQSLEAIDATDPKLLAIPEAHRTQRIAETRKAVLHSALKTICAFLNSTGGTLLIGVADDGEIKGLGSDLELVPPKKDIDAFENKLRTLIKDRFQPLPLALIDVTFHETENQTVCRVAVRPDMGVHHLDGKVYVRDGNRTVELIGPDLTHWVTKRSRQA